MDKGIIIFKEIKEKTINIIESLKSSSYEVTQNSKNKTTGIYMIYIDGFESNNVIPIYIGKSIDIQRRYKQHYTELLALNRLSYEEYKKYFFLKNTSFYDGHFKTSKIFKYMIENQKTLKDFHMIILEQTDESELDFKEKKYINEFNSCYFGFNQLNSLTDLRSLQMTKSKHSEKDIVNYLDVVNYDNYSCKIYQNYGYTSFNYLYAMPKDIKNTFKLALEDFSWLEKDITTIEKNILHLSRQLGDCSIRSQLKARKSILKLRQNKLESEKQFEVFYNEKLENDFKVKKIYNKVYKQIQTRNKDRIISVESFNKYYFPRYFETNLIQSFRDEDIYKAFVKKENYKSEYKDASEKFEKLRSINNKELYTKIFPENTYKRFPLKDNYQKKTIQLLEDYQKENTCYINFFISNNANNRNIDVEKKPDILNITYTYTDKDGISLNNEFFIKSKTTSNKTFLDYIEKDFYDPFAFKRQPFNITMIEDGYISNSFISTLAEYKHGINDYTVTQHELLELDLVLNQIEKLINVDTRFKISISESYNCIKQCFTTKQLQNEFISKLVTNKLLKIKKQGITNKKVTNKAKLVVKKSIVHPKISRAERYIEKVKNKSNGSIEASNYISSKEKVTALCRTCEHIWYIRSDHLLARTYCPKCSANKS